MELQIEQIVLSYGTHPVLKNLCMELKSGYLYGLAGVNGAGKTSLLNCISGLQKYQEGSILLDHAKLITSDVGYLETKFFSYPHMTGRDYLELFSAGTPEFKISIWNKLFDLPLDEYISDYSSGMQKKLGILGVIALDRPVILLDEPFNALDLEAVELMKRILPELKKLNKIVLITSHIIETITESCDQIFYMKDGKIFKTYYRNEFPSLRADLTQHLDEKFNKDINEAFQL